MRLTEINPTFAAACVAVELVEWSRGALVGHKERTESLQKDSLSIPTPWTLRLSMTLCSSSRRSCLPWSLPHRGGKSVDLHWHAFSKGPELVLDCNCDGRAWRFKCRVDSNERPRRAMDCVVCWKQLVSNACFFFIYFHLLPDIAEQNRVNRGHFRSVLSTLESWFSVALRLHKPWGLLWTGSPGRPPRLLHWFSMLLYVHIDDSNC